MYCSVEHSCPRHGYDEGADEHDNTLWNGLRENLEAGRKLMHAQPVDDGDVDEVNAK